MEQRSEAAAALALSLLAALELGDLLLDGEHAADEEEDLVGGEVVADPGGEALDRIAREAEVVEGRIVGDRQVGRHDDLEEQGVLRVAEALADYVLDLLDEGPDRVGDLLVGEGGGRVGVDHEARQYRQGELGELVGLAAAHAELLEIDALLDVFLLAEEMDVIFHGPHLSFVRSRFQKSAMTLLTGPLRKASYRWLAPCAR